MKADHAIIQLWNLRAIIISEDKYLSMDEAILQNLDQLRTYAHSIEGSQFPIFYGIASNFDKWRFCCYIPSKNNTVDTARNFHISQEIPLKLNIDNINTRAPEDNVEELISIIQSFFEIDVDNIVAKRYFTCCKII